MMHLAPGDQLWDRFKVESAIAGGLAGAWLSPLHPESIQAKEVSHLLVPLSRPGAHPLAALLVAVEEALGTKTKHGVTEVPLIGAVEWMGNSGRNGVAILSAKPGRPLAELLRASGPLTSVQTLRLLLDLAGSLADLLEFADDSAAPPELLTWVARLLHPDALSLRIADARLQLRPLTPEPSVELSLPSWPDFAAPEVYQGSRVGPPAWVFGAGRVAAFCLGCGATVERGNWSALADWAAGRRNLLREFSALMAGTAVPEELRKLLERSLANDPEERFEHLAEMLVALRALESAAWTSERVLCRRCGFILSGHGACPCCEGCPPAKTKSSAALPRVHKGSSAALPAVVAVPENMTLIPSGTYLSGERKTPRTLRAFAIDTLPVTESDYKKYLKNKGQSPRPGGPGSRSSAFDNYPVTHLNWFEASEYAEYFGKRLPTIHEWEKAARGVDGRKFPCGNSFKPGCGNLRALNGEHKEPAAALAPVGSCRNGASPFGVLDMAGNILEWTSSARRAGMRLFRAVKGAAYTDGSGQLARCAGIQYLLPETAEPYLGFRCVKDLE
jgi:formylglycine-generating enzyme required for sulfatase activity